jgi:hypothetical protein
MKCEICSKKYGSYYVSDETRFDIDIHGKCRVCQEIRDDRKRYLNELFPSILGLLSFVALIFFWVWLGNKQSDRQDRWSEKNDPYFTDHGRNPYKLKGVNVPGYIFSDDLKGHKYGDTIEDTNPSGFWEHQVGNGKFYVIVGRKNDSR